MEKYDPVMAARVWRRVHGQPEGLCFSTLVSLAAEERQNAVTLLRLSRQFRGKPAAILQQLSQKEEEHAKKLLEISGDLQP